MGSSRTELPEAHQRAGDAMVEAYVKSANGEEPWGSFLREERWMKFGLEGCQMESREEGDTWG